jgi:hypothetical protein
LKLGPKKSGMIDREDLALSIRQRSRKAIHRSVIDIQEIVTKRPRQESFGKGLSK